MTEDAAHAERWSAVEEGAELLQQGETDEAIRELSQVIEDDPNNEYACFFLGNAYFDKEDWERALKAFVRALELAPRYIGAMVGAGHALRMLSRFDQALRMGKEAMLVRRDDPDVLYLLGVTHFQRGDTHEAIQYFEKFLETRPEVETAFEVEGMLQVLRGEVQPHPGSDGGES